MKRTLLLCSVISAVGLAGSAYAWPQLGPVVPIHWGIGGQPDGYAPKAMGLLLLPAMALLSALLVSGLFALDPRRDHIAASMPALRTMTVGIAGFLVFVPRSCCTRCSATADCPGARCSPRWGRSS